MELTWITFPTIVVTVSLVAYYAAYLLKGNDLLVNKIDVVDIDQAAGLARGNSWISLFSPQNRDYTIRTIPVSLDHDSPPLAEKDSSGQPVAAAIRHGSRDELVQRPENQFGAMGNSGRRFSFAGNGYAYEPTSNVEWLENVRIPIWSTKCISSRWFGPAVPLVDSDLQPVGTDRLAGIITNRQSVPLEDAILAFGKQVYLLGTIAPGRHGACRTGQRSQPLGALEGQTAQLSLRPALESRPPDRPRRSDARGHVSRQPVDPVHRAGSRQRSPGRSRFDRTACSAPADARGPDQCPGAQLEIDNAPSTPKIDQLTLVRIILPLTKKAKS